MTHTPHGLHTQSQGNGAPLLLLHGLGSSVRDWDAQIAHFSTDFHVIAVDLPGHGQSPDLSGPVDITDFSDQVANTLDATDTVPCHVVGISMGAMVALQLALDHPKRVASLVLVNSPADMRPTGITMRIQVLQRKLLVRLFGMRKVGKVLAERLFPDPAHADIRSTFAARWAENNPANYRYTLNAILRWHVTERLPDVVVPTLIMVAEHDYTPLAWKQQMLESMPLAELVIVENSHHATPVEHPMRFNELVSSFLARIGTGNIPMSDQADAADSPENV